MIALYDSLVSDGLKPHVAWRAAFAIVPVPFLLVVAAAILILGTDHPAGKWSDRHQVLTRRVDHTQDDLEKKEDLKDIQVTVTPADPSVCRCL